MRMLLGLLLLLALTGNSRATYCLCKDGVAEKDLQTSIDYACGVLGDCNQIHEKGTATTSPNPPSTLVTGCIYPSSPGNAGTGAPGTPTFPGPPAFGPTGGFDPSGNDALSLITSIALTLGFSVIVFL
ncbi:hypothetical protein F2Q70_00031811 [Brassica cretica]|uniref:X8 domain-containing protein n=1 Tax=Brassica cretica TaxID=69181 RepID=A0A8S9FPM1_BRACR|nr:hypothetical protein F2Q70_00031811 [Brassica cretica]